MEKLPKSPNRYKINFVPDYYKKISLCHIFKLDSTTEGYLFNILKNVEVTKAAGIDKISGKLSKYEVRFLAKPISELCNLSMTLGSISDACIIAKLKPLFNPIWPGVVGGQIPTPSSSHTFYDNSKNN